MEVSSGNRKAVPRARPAPVLLDSVRRSELNQAVRMLQPLSLESLLHLLIALSSVDQARLEQLLARGDVSYLLDNKLQQRAGHWPHGEVFADAAEKLAKISAAIIANPKKSGVTYRHSYIVSGLAKLLPTERRFDFYRNLLGIVSEEPRKSWIRLDGGGIYYVYIDAAEAAFQAKNTAYAFDACTRAREIADRLPDNELSAKARFRGAVKFASYLAYQNASQVRQLAAEAHADLDRELSNVLRFNPSDGRLLRLQAALTRSNLWRSGDSKKVWGPITAAEGRIDLLTRALLDAYAVACDHGFIDIPSLDAAANEGTPEDRRAIGRVLVDIAQSYARIGDDRRSLWYVTRSREYNLSARSRVDVDIALATSSNDIAVIAQLCENFANRHILGQLSGIPAHQHIRALRQYSIAARRLSNLLKANNYHSSAAFWRRQGNCWLAESGMPDSLWGTDQTQTGGSPGQDLVLGYINHVRQVGERLSQLKQADGRTISTRQRERQRIRVRKRNQVRNSRSGQVEIADASDRQVGDSLDFIPRVSPEEEHARFVYETLAERFQEVDRYISRESVNEVITILSSVGQSSNLIVDDRLRQMIIDSVALIANWRPTDFADLRVSAADVDNSQAVTVALRAAAALARRFMPHRLTPLLLQLSHRPDFSASVQYELTNEALEAARSQGRPLQELRAFHRYLTLLDELSLTETEEDIISWLSRILIHSNKTVALFGISGIFDLAFGVAVELADITEFLAQAGRVELAFQASALAQGWTTAALTRNPEAAGELNSALKARASDDDDLMDGLYSTILGRICGVGAAQPFDLPSSTEIAASQEPAGSATIRFLQASSKRVRAIGCVRPSTYFSFVIDATPKELLDLADAVWFRLRSKELGAAERAVFQRLYETCIGPGSQHLSSAKRLTFAFHRSIPFLPLHGALGPDGFLGARLPVGYEIASRNAGPIHADAGADAERRIAAILGWDRATMADVEAADVSALLARQFTLVEPGSAHASCSELILNPERDLSILHVAGHGHLLRYPNAMESSVELLPGITVSALDLLNSGCRCRFVFLNVCGVGNSETTAGDSYGFALAARSRGASAFIAPATYIAPTDAHTFAALFYEAALTREVTEAAFIVTRELIARGAPPAAWLPYAVFGNLGPLQSM